MQSRDYIISGGGEGNGVVLPPMWCLKCAPTNWGEPERAPHRREVCARILYIYIYGTSVTRAPPYTKPIGRMQYLAMISPCQEKSIADHVDVHVCGRDQASQRYRTDRCCHAI